MRTWQIIRKSLLEHMRSFWILLLTISMGPFFIMLYYLITEASDPHYDICVVNLDEGIRIDKVPFSHADYMMGLLPKMLRDTVPIPLTLVEAPDRESALGMMMQGKADAIVVFPEGFSRDVAGLSGGETATPGIELIGDLTNTYYLVSAVWAEALISHYVAEASGRGSNLGVKETALGSSGSLNDFEVAVPGLLIISIIMLMFTASIAFVNEVERRTIIRLRLSELRTGEYLLGNTVVQIGIGILSIALTFLTARAFGYESQGSNAMVLLIAAICSLSIVAFSLIIAAMTRSANEVLVVGNFPLFLFMFFTGAAFPIQENALFSVLGYGISLPGLMSPSHAISALRKVLVMDAGIGDILPELTAMLVLTLIYFAIGAIWFRKRHMKLS